MTKGKLEQLFEATRREPAPMPATGWETRVMGAANPEREREPASLLDQLSALFPRAALASALVIGLCVAGEFGSSLTGQPDLTSGLVELSDDWLFAANGY
jgi:hypothetical protein